MTETERNALLFALCAIRDLGYSTNNTRLVDDTLSHLDNLRTEIDLRKSTFSGSGTLDLK